MNSTARIALYAAIAFLAVLSCGQDRTADHPRNANPEPDPGEEPVVGGPCTYRPLSFSVIVDSVLTSGDVILHAVDSIPQAAAHCPLRDEGNGRWRASQSVVQRVVSGDTAVVEGEVIETGTCTPCSIVVRPVRER
jgi:hypothetical protein